MEDDSIHALAEFFVPEIGWIPVDIASYQQFGRTPPSMEGEGETAAAASWRLPFFGEQSSNFLALHWDVDFMLEGPHSAEVGAQVVPWLEVPAFWVVGENTEQSSFSVGTKFKLNQRQPIS
jgi:hypothetical protein